ncbi:hypothetical protein JXA12_02205 [Candidatus Woesearchaeota archaeon]|nr:hypothetical protein [Candidatus Woesearchaeota archaeon]
MERRTEKKTTEDCLKGIRKSEFTTESLFITARFTADEGYLLTIGSLLIDGEHQEGHYLIEIARAPSNEEERARQRPEHDGLDNKELRRRVSEECLRYGYSLEAVLELTTTSFKGLLVPAQTDELATLVETIKELRRKHGNQFQEAHLVSNGRVYRLHYFVGLRTQRTFQETSLLLIAPFEEVTRRLERAADDKKKPYGEDLYLVRAKNLQKGMPHQTWAILVDKDPGGIEYKPGWPTLSIESYTP